jgi:Transposase zinc-ribbon domain
MFLSDLPTDLNAFFDRFSSEDRCRDHLFALKWPDGFLCPCGGRRCYRLQTRLAYECTACGAQQALLAGTLFEQTKSPLRHWFRAIYFFLASKGGLSALELKRHMGFKSDQTAWSWLHKLRRAMAVQDGPLVAPIEVDETLLGVVGQFEISSIFFL